SLFLKPMHGRVEGGCDYANQRLRSKRTRLISHSLKVARSCAMPLEPFLIFAWGNGSSTFSRGSTEPFPNRFRQFFWKTIWREKYLAHAALGRFPQGSFLLF